MGWELNASGTRVLAASSRADTFTLSGAVDAGNLECCLQQCFEEGPSVRYTGWMDRRGLWGLYGRGHRVFRLFWE